MPNLASSLNDRRMKKEDEMNIDAKYNSFNPQTWLYLGYDGCHHYCRLP